MGKNQRRRAEKAGKVRPAKEETRERAWLTPLLVFLGALAVIALALVAAADK